MAVLGNKREPLEQELRETLLQHSTDSHVHLAAAADTAGVTATGWRRS